MHVTIRNIFQSERNGDTELCARILDVDSAIRSAVVVEGVKVSGFAASAKASDILGRSPDFREKIGL